MSRFDNSLAKALERYPDGAPDHVIARALGITEADLERKYLEIVAKLRKEVGADTE
jgi:hypothetical protein